MSTTLITDLYQLTMNAAYHANNKNSPATFDLFVRKLPKNWGYLISAGLEDVINYIENLKFKEEDVNYLREQKIFSEDYLSTLKDFKFTGNIMAVPEGTIVFPNEPLIRVTAPKQEAQLIETYLLNKINYQTLIATKASRITRAAKGAPVIDFGLRRAHDNSAGITGARAAYIGGCAGTSNVEAGRIYGIPIKGTHAHSFVMSFEKEIDAFRAYAKTFPDSTTLLIDTYNVMEGAKNAAIVAKELEQKGHKLNFVRIDSGDLAEHSKNVRKYLDEQGLNYVGIIASNDLNEQKIDELIKKGARINAYGVGTEMITSKDCPALGGVYKLSEDTDEKGNLVAKIKLSEGKQTFPGKKQAYRLENNDVIALEEEKHSGTPLLEPIFREGKLVYKKPTLDEIKARAREQLCKIPENVKTIHEPAQYEVRTSPKLAALIKKLTEERK